MTEEECAELLILCGALHDIAEKAHEYFTTKQVHEVRMRLEKLVVGSEEYKKFFYGTNSKKHLGFYSKTKI